MMLLIKLVRDYATLFSIVGIIAIVVMFLLIAKSQFSRVPKRNKLF